MVSDGKIIILVSIAGGLALVIGIICVRPHKQNQIANKPKIEEIQSTQITQLAQPIINELSAIDKLVANARSNRLRLAADFKLGDVGMIAEYQVKLVRQDGILAIVFTPESFEGYEEKASQLHISAINKQNTDTYGSNIDEINANYNDQCAALIKRNARLVFISRINTSTLIDGQLAKTEEIFVVNGRKQIGDNTVLELEAH